jgi:ribonuclease HII
MVEQELAYAGYGFDRHKGYGTRLHRAVLDSRGVSSLHRRSFAPIRKLLVRSES